MPIGFRETVVFNRILIKPNSEIEKEWLTLATLTICVKLSTTDVMSASTLCNKDFCFCKEAAAAAAVGPFSPPDPDIPPTEPPPLFIVINGPCRETNQESKLMPMEED